MRKIRRTKGVVFGSNSTGRQPQNPYRAAELSGMPSHFGAQLHRLRLGTRLPNLRRR